MSDPLLHDLKRRVVTHPEDAEARFRLGEAFFGERRYADAVRQLEKVLALVPEHTNARRLLARSYAQDDRLAVAERTMREAVERRPDDPSLRETLAEVLLCAGRPDDALLQLEEAAERDPDGLERRLELARIYASRGLLERARRHLEEAKARHPQDARVVQRLGELAAAEGTAAVDVAGASRGERLGRAREAFSAPALNARLVAAGLGGALEALKKDDVQAAKRALVAAPPSAAGDLLRAELAFLEGDAARAEKALERCTAAWPDCALAWERLAERRLARGDAGGALAAAASARSADGTRVAARVLQAEALALAGRHAEAEAAYLEAARADPGSDAAERLAAYRASRRTAEAEARPVGRVSALAWNPRGGIVSRLEAVVVPGSGQLQLTGNVADVGHEAARVAFSCLKARAAELGITERLHGRDLHLHYTDMEHAKDGPSAGLALFLAAYSAFTQRPLRPALAASGELTLHGAVKPVGGIHEKLVAAVLHGVRRVLLPRRNLLDARALPPEVTRRLEIVPVDGAAEALGHALLEER